MTFLKNYMEDLLKFDSLLAFIVSLFLFYKSLDNNISEAIQYAISFVIIFLFFLNLRKY